MNALRRHPFAGHHRKSDEAQRSEPGRFPRGALDATKPDIAKAVEKLFKVKVKAVNTITQKGKTKLFRGRPFVRSDVKKAIVTLEEGYQIDITTGL